MSIVRATTKSNFGSVLLIFLSSLLSFFFFYFIYFLFFGFFLPSFLLVLRIYINIYVCLDCPTEYISRAACSFVFVNPQQTRTFVISLLWLERTHICNALTCNSHREFGQMYVYMYESFIAQSRGN